MGTVIGVAEWNHKIEDRFLFWGKQKMFCWYQVFFILQLYYTLAFVGCEVAFYDIYPIGILQSGGER